MAARAVAQGNALKTVVAMPFVLSGKEGRVHIGAHGERHEITVRVDPIEQHPVILRKTRAAKDVKTGTEIKIHWPQLVSSILTDARVRFLRLADDYTFLNPHLALTVDWFGERVTTPATNRAWRKWGPLQPMSAHWYTIDDLERLFCAYIAHDRAQDPPEDRYIRDVLTEFRDLTASAKRKKVLDETGLTRTRLSTLDSGDGLRRDVTALLHAAMQRYSRLVKPKLLGVLGREHIAQRFEALGCEMESFQYRPRCEFDNDGLPTVIEAAFAWRDDNKPRRLITGVNWSGAIGNPFRTLGSAYGDGLSALLENRKADSVAPVVLLLHVAQPRVRYADRGKSTVLIR